MNENVIPEKELSKYEKSMKENGLIRASFNMAETHKDAIEALAKKHKITQGQVIEVLLEQMRGEEELASFFKLKAETKTDGRSKKHPKRELLKDMKDLTPEQLAQLAAQVAQMKGEKQ
jgi:predicted DNA-binding ribbon-helix-helix protein